MTDKDLQVPKKKPGRPKGSKNPPPFSGHKSMSPNRTIAMLCESLAKTHWKDIHAALVAGLHAKPPCSLQYLRLLADYLDGRPWQGTDETGAKVIIQIGVSG